MCKEGKRKVMTGQLSSKESLEILWQMRRLPFILVGLNLFKMIIT